MSGALANCGRKEKPGGRMDRSVMSSHLWHEHASDGRNEQPGVYAEARITERLCIGSVDSKNADIFHIFLPANKWKYASHG
eukprot:1162143-Pelagomonas_calceolata.AAC.6